jgi:hypothetical protein
MTEFREKQDLFCDKGEGIIRAGFSTLPACCASVRCYRNRRTDSHFFFFYAGGFEK